METAESGYRIKRFEGETKRYVQTLSLRDNPQLIAEYRRLHSKESMWKEILDGIREVGILEMEIYILGTRLVMIVETTADFDWDRQMSLLAKQPRQAEWENVVAKYQQTVPGLASSEKWKLMERMFHLY